MTTTVSIVEGEPAERPRVHCPGINNNDFDGGAVWQRIEGWISYRWGVRTVTFIVEGEGHWRAPLAPFTAASVERWEGSAWAATTLAETALGGLQLPACGPYCITGVVGSEEDPPAAVAEAFRRLAEYFFAIRAASPMIASSRHEQAHGEDRIAIDRAPQWTARAMVYSGAADLLRPYRRVS